ncbi:MAG: hypothetical protein BMS9Abin05_1384 [Rhodothermia bacterium]|nr:MAG: hypothetical protein BMS9Abin05_1384 [Rhodothermia bacterium]
MSDQNTTQNGQVEPEGLNAGALGVVVVGGLVLILAATFVVVSVTNVVFHDARMESTESSGYPTLTQTRETAEEILSSYAPTDRDAGIYRIPIDRAMGLIVEEAQNTTGEGGN